MKPIPNEYYTTILDRLLRLEPACVRYKRVFVDIINKFSSSKQGSKTLSDDEIIALASEIFEYNNLKSTNDVIKQTLINLEQKTFKNNPISKKYLNADIDYKKILNNIEINENTPKNVIWLKSHLNSKKPIAALRKEKSLLYPIEKIILVEGQTEYILLKTLFNLFDFDLDKLGIFVFSTDGKNRSARKYYELIEYLELPIFVLLDKDASQIKNLITPKLRKKDKIYLLKSGEFEDIIPKDVLIKAINSYHKNGYHISKADFEKELTTVQNLENIYKKYGFGDFKKAKFANILNEYIIKNAKKEDFNTSEIKEVLKYLQ